MGKITKRADGRYVTTVTISKGVRRHVYGGTRKECAANVEKLRQKIADGIAGVEAPKTMKLLLDQWIASLEAKRKPNTLRCYKQIIKHHLAPHIGKYAPADLTVDHIQAIIDKLQPTHAGNSVRNVRACLRRALNYAMKRRYVAYNAAALVELPPIEQQPIHILTPDQVRKFLDVISGHRLEALYRLTLVLGLREGEVLGLRWEDIDLDTGTLRITGTLQRVNGKLQRVSPKTEQSQKAMPLPQPIITLLRPMHKDSGYVFTTKTGNPIIPRNLAKQFKMFLRHAGLPEIVRFHDLRHLTASTLIAQGEHPRAVMEHLRHSQISVTMDYYGHILQDEHRRIADNLGRVFA